MRERLLIALGALAVLAPVLWAPLVMDDLALVGDAVITNADGWWRSFGWGQTRPLAWWTYWLNYQAHGAAPMGYHVVNWLLHGVCVWLVHGLLAGWGAGRGAAIGAALFGVHPIQTEAVAFVFSRPALLMTVFVLLALRAWQGGRWWVAVGWFVPALLAKEECVGVPLLLGFWHLIGTREKGERGPLAAMFALALAAGLRVLYVTTVTAGSGAGAEAGVTPLAYLAAQGEAIVRYAKLLVWPFALSLESPLRPGEGWFWWVAVAGWIVVPAWRTGLQGWGREVLGALLLLVPSTSFLPAMDLSADRRMYLPMVLLAALAGRVLAARPAWIAVSLVGALSLVTVRQALLWQSPEKLWRQAQKEAPGKVRPYLQLARLTPPEEALGLLEKVEVFAPADARIASEKGRVYLEMNQPAQALAAFGKALALTPGDALALNNRGVALSRLGQREAAIGDFRRALERDPCLFDAAYNLRRLGEAVAVAGHCRYTPEQKRRLQGDGQ